MAAGVEFVGLPGVLGERFHDTISSHGVLCSIQSTIPLIDDILKEMAEPDASRRPTSAEALLRLSDAVNALPPRASLIPPIILPEQDDDS